MQYRRIAALVASLVFFQGHAAHFDKGMLTKDVESNSSLPLAAPEARLFRERLESANSSVGRQQGDLWPFSKLMDGIMGRSSWTPPAEPSKLKVLCVVVCRTLPEFLLVNEMEKQLRQCDDYVVASNRSVSSSFNFRAQTLIHGPMDSHQAAYLGAGALNTKIFMQLWSAIAGRKDIETFDWIVKIDPDTFFRPSSLRLALWRYGKEPVIVAHRPNNVTHLPDQGFVSLEHYPVRGDPSIWYTARLWSMYAISRPIFDVFRKSGCHVTADMSPHEDMWWGECMKTEPFSKIGAHLAQPEGRCVDFAWNAYVWKPKDYDGGRFPITANMIQDLVNGKTLYNEQGFCMSPNITAFHPIKSPLAHRKLARMFEDGADPKMYWDSKTFLPVGGWSTSQKHPTTRLVHCNCFRVKTNKVQCLKRSRTSPATRLSGRSSQVSCYKFSDEDAESTMYSGSGSGIFSRVRQ